MSEAFEPVRPVRVGVLVDLLLTPSAGGHVKCWEHFAQAAASRPDDVDLTVHFAGEADEERRLTGNARYRILRPSLSTELLPLPVKQPDHSDLAPVHWRLRRFFEDYDVLHVTDAWFAYARTALRQHRHHGTPLVLSTHTEVPKYTRVVTRKIVERLIRPGVFRDHLLRSWQVHRRAERLMRRRFERYVAHCEHVLASSDADFERVLKVLPAERVSRLRRGIDKELFHPRHRDRARIDKRYGLPPGGFLLLCVGRLDEAKRPLTLVKAVRLLLDRGIPIHAAFVGRGPLREQILEQLGPATTVIDPLPHEELRDIYASADVFVFPSTTEVMPNVVIEAKACGLPVVLSRHGGSRQLVDPSGDDGLLIDTLHPADWAAAIEALWRDADRRRSLGAAARRHVEQGWPSWKDVLEEDLLPVWQRVVAPSVPASGRRQPAVRPPGIGRAIAGAGYREG
jgi:glycosyltransferase involved in cell wall biosynthesis